MEDAEFLVGCARTNLGNDFYRASPRLKLVQLVSAGYDRVDIEAARKAKVPVCNNGGANSIAVAEHTIMLVLAVAKKLVWHHNNVAAGQGPGGGPPLPTPLPAPPQQPRRPGPRRHP